MARIFYVKKAYGLRPCMPFYHSTNDLLYVQGFHKAFLQFKTFITDKIS